METSEWMQNHSIKLLSNPKCTSQKGSKNYLVKKIKSGIIDCSTPYQPEDGKITLKLQPFEDQIVFEGDSLKLNCVVTGLQTNYGKKREIVSNTSLPISWSLLDKKLGNEYSKIENKYSLEGGTVTNSLYISKIDSIHSGHWKCQLNHNHTTVYSKTILVIVISNTTKYCDISITNNNKGLYTWPKTITGYTVEIPCQVNENMNAFHVCNLSGQWGNVNTSLCAYVSEITRILEQFSKVDLSLTKVNVYESADHFKNYTSNLTLLRDKMDVIFIAKTVKNYLNYLSKEKEMIHILVNIINNVQQLPRNLLEEANVQDGSCKKLVRAVEVISEYTSISQTSIAAQEFKIKQDVFLGMTCTWYTNVISDDIRKNPEFHCSSTRDSWQPVLGDKILEASIQIPSTLFNQILPHDRIVTSQRMFIGLFTNGNFFPDQKNNTKIYGSVAGIKLVNIPYTNLSVPVYIMMRIADGSGIPAVWDPNANNGLGGWEPKHCQTRHYLDGDIIVFTCDHLGYYAVLQSYQYFEENISTKSIPGAKFKLSHPAVYIGGFILFVCVLMAVVTYLMCFSSIQMAKKAKHSLINMWISLLWLCFIYTFGIRQTEDAVVCQAVGIIIHYLTLCTLLWMCICVSNMYKRVNKNEASEILTDISLQVEQPIQKPILGLYLVGWGVALIVCGISGAVNMKEYASYSYCFLSSPPALSALFIPVVILLLSISVFLLLIRCAIRNTDTQMTQLSEGTQGTENLDIDLLEPNICTNTGNESVKSESTSSSMIEDCEHAPMTQLRAHLIVLIMYLSLWICAAVSTVHPFPSLTCQDDLFNILYGIVASILGLFIFFFYCIARSDVRVEWSNMKCWLLKKQICCRSRSVSDAAQLVPPPVTVNQATEVQVTSRSSSRTSSQPKSLSHQSNNLKGAAGLNEESGKSGNVDLVVLHRQQYRTNNTVPVYELSSMNGAEMFYNPHQIGVAKKFFKKQKRNMMKHNNLGTRHRDTHSVKSHNSDMSSSLFGAGVKVNNTNIHVEEEKNLKQTKRNPNILSDWGADREYNVDNLNSKTVQQLMFSAKKSKVSNSKKQKMNKSYDVPVVENMRTVSQQCSLEYTSDTVDIGESTEDLKNTSHMKNAEKPQIYVNPMDHLQDQVEWGKGISLRSSVSTSDVDELYSQIRQGISQKEAKENRRHTLDEQRFANMGVGQTESVRASSLTDTSSSVLKSETRL